MIIHFVHRLPSTFLLLQLKCNWYPNNMATVMNKRKVLSVKGEVKMRRQKENGKTKANVSGIWSCKLYDPNNLEKQN